MLERNVEIENKTIFVTGAAGFIGANLVLELHDAWRAGCEYLR